MSDVTLEDLVVRGVPYSWECVECGMNTAPGCTNARQMLKAFGRGEDAIQEFDDRTEVYCLRASLWEIATNGNTREILCIGCVESRIGRRLRPKDFSSRNELNLVPGTDRLISRRMGLAFSERASAHR